MVPTKISSIYHPHITREPFLVTSDGSPEDDIDTPLEVDDDEMLDAGYVEIPRE